MQEAAIHSRASANRHSPLAWVNISPANCFAVLPVPLRNPLQRLDDVLPGDIADFLIAHDRRQAVQPIADRGRALLARDVLRHELLDDIADRRFRRFRSDGSGAGCFRGSFLSEPGLPLHTRIVPGTACRPPRARNGAGLGQRQPAVTQPFADALARCAVGDI